MKPEDSPFPCYWWGTGLENAGLGSVRPSVGTYGRYEYAKLPPVPIEIRDNLDWLIDKQPFKQNIGDDKASENAMAIAALQKSAEMLGIQLPSVFRKFMEVPALHQRIRSNTLCFLDLCPALVPSPVGSGYLIRFLADSEGCQFWYLYLTENGADHSVVTSPDFYGIESECPDEDFDPQEIDFCADCFETFLFRFWLENEIWYAGNEKTLMPKLGVDYIEQYLRKK